MPGAEKAVHEAASLSAGAALKERVIDLIAAANASGRKVKGPSFPARRSR
jgi:membrane-bound ClpP family serine protease